MGSVADFFSFAIVRETIRIRKEAGKPWPWTDDRVLRHGFFCNVFREDDKITRWFKREIRDPVSSDPYKSVRACAAFRFLNSIAAGEAIRPFLLGEWNEKGVAKALRRVKGPILGPAYMIRSPNGYDKITGICRLLRPIFRDVDRLVLCESLESLHQELCEYHCVGPFLAYEIVTDLRHTTVLREAFDINTWASAGPGAARGLWWITGNRYSHTSATDQEGMLAEMQKLLALSRDIWPWPEKPWEMREVEHTLCEYDKFNRMKAGDRPKRWYRK